MEKPHALHCKKRRECFAQILQEQHIAAAIFEDTEGRRDPAISYFTGHPGDAVLVINAKAESILYPWDENLAAMMADADKIIPLTKFSRNTLAAIKSVLQKLHIQEGARIDISPSTPYPQFLKYVDALPSCNVLCRETGSHASATKMRAIKDSYEISCIREACRVADSLINQIEEEIKNGKLQTETDVALLIERECRIAGCQGTGFETLVANPSRSFGIHCFPPYTAEKFPMEGLSIIDFGVKKDGYTSDVTVTFVNGKISSEQEKQIDLVQKAYNAALELYKNDVPIQAAAIKADSIFNKAKTAMPHSLGHGIGLEAHEYPTIKPSVPCDELFLPGMVVTLEPGLYNPATGGCRLENDILITKNGNEVLTHSRIIRL